MTFKKISAVFILFSAIFSNGFAAIVLPEIISDSMVLQRNQPVPIWGKADAGETITLNFIGQSVTTVADEKGMWKIWIGPFPANAAPANMVISGKNQIELKNILVGEVWFCSGQSNMQWTLEQSEGGKEAIKTANYPDIRLFNVSRDVAFKRKNGKMATWQVCSPKTAKSFSGVGYFFALELYQELGIPIGVINSSYGGSQIEAWTPIEYIAASEEFRPCIEREKIWAAERQQVKKEHDQQMQEWREASKKAKAAGQTPPPQPRVPDALRDYRIAASIYNNMVAPLIPFAIKGAMWYQGESNEERAEQYGLLLPTMIQAWRERWGQGDFPFAIVQLPNFRPSSPDPIDEAWSHLRDAQRKTFMQVPNTGLIVTIDIGKEDDIHPPNKKEVANRLFRWAVADVYNKPLTKSGPIFSKAEFKRKKAIIHFSEVGDGLNACDGNPLQEFAIAAEDKMWIWANAIIKDKDKVIVWSDKIKRPKAVRYAFNNNPINPNLTNETCIPASPFRTDDWPGPTDGKR